MTEILPIDKVKIDAESVCTIGNFDGVHLGHKKILDVLKKEAIGSNLKSVVITFEPHPRKVLHPGSFRCSIVNLKTKIFLLQQEKVDCIVIIKFTEDLYKKTAKEFVDFLKERLNCRKIVIGKDWRFGYKKEGDVQFARSYGEQIGIDIVPVEEVKIEEEKISSSRIRELLVEGNLSAASRLLGREYMIREMVVKGNQIGREIGFPTINFKPEEDLCLKRGVYAGFVELEDRRLPAVINFGYRPTVDGNNLFLEAHVIDKSAKVDVKEGMFINVYFKKFIREEIKFSSIMDLKRQIEADIKKTEKVLSNVEVYI